ncbi:thiamine diphosphokinase [Bariatricus sp. SGI.154]|uniref:thiamine diphosphokinase n=1 Tax=Bariatricus sp. SGI.154 TaxID=3420549 RepID=UPI003CFBCDBF
MSKRIVIVSGGELDEELTLSILEKQEGEYVIGVDKGMEFLYRHQIMPSYIVGDFDSVKAEIADYYKNETNVPIREYNPVKDASDTEIAIRLAMTLGCSELIILGATGGRLDHLWANVQSLTIPFKAGVDAKIVDRQNMICLIGDGETHLRKDEMYGPYFSVFPLGEEIFGFNIKGAKYPLRNHILTPYDSLCVSNQIAEDEDEAVISFAAGIVILMQTRDKK